MKWQKHLKEHCVGGSGRLPVGQCVQQSPKPIRYWSTVSPAGGTLVVTQSVTLTAVVTEATDGVFDV